MSPLILLWCFWVVPGEQCAYVTPKRVGSMQTGGCSYLSSFCPKVPADSCYYKSSVSDKFECTSSGTATWNRFKNSDCSGDSDDLYTSTYSNVNGAKSYDCNGSGKDCQTAKYSNSFFDDTITFIINECIESAKTFCDSSEGKIEIVLYNTSNCLQGTETNRRTVTTQSDTVSIDCDPSDDDAISSLWLYIALSIVTVILLCICVIWRHWDMWGCRPICNGSPTPNEATLQPIEDQMEQTDRGDIVMEEHETAHPSAPPQEYEENKNETNHDIEGGEGEGVGKYSSIKAWLYSVDGLDDDDKEIYFNLFVENGFDSFVTIKALTMDDLLQIGVHKLGHRKVIMQTVTQL
eukprot:34527_1